MRKNVLVGQTIIPSNLHLLSQICICRRLCCDNFVNQMVFYRLLKNASFPCFLTLNAALNISIVENVV